MDLMPGPALWPIVIPGVTALGGVALGRWLDVAGEGKRWKRDQRTKAYASFTAAAEVVMVELSQDEHETMQLRCLDAFARLSQAAAEVDVFGELETMRAAHDLWNFVNDLMDDWKELLAKSDATWNEDTAAYRVLLDQFTEAVRASLGEKSLTALSGPAG